MRFIQKLKLEKYLLSPFVSQELQSRFGLHGYVAAYVLPEGFQTNCSGVEYEKEGVHYMDIYVHAASVTKVDAYSTFN